MKKLHFIILINFLAITLASAQSSLHEKHYNLDNKLALQGYDPVSYFTKNKAVKGDKKIASIIDGIIYYFSSSEHKNLFLKDFKKYEPQYGGWCAYAMGATGEKVEIDPETFKIKNGKLYLFYHTWANNTLPKWNKDEATLNTKADKNWQSIYH